MNTTETTDATYQEYPVKMAEDASQWVGDILDYLYSSNGNILISPLSPQETTGERNLLKVVSSTPLSERIVLGPEYIKRVQVITFLNQVEKQLPNKGNLTRYKRGVDMLAQLIRRGEELIWHRINSGKFSAIAVSSTHSEGAILKTDDEYDYPFFVLIPHADNPTSELITRINEEGEVDNSEYTKTFIKRKIQMGIQFIYPELSNAETIDFIHDFFTNKNPDDYEYIRRLLLSLRLDEVIHESGIFSEYIRYQKRQRLLYNNILN